MKPKVAILMLTFVVVVTAQAHPTSPRRFDEFGALGHCDLGARLDNFAIHLQQTPASVGYIISYGPDVEGPGSGKAPLALMKEYLVDARGLPKHRIKTSYGGRYRVLGEPRIELWIVPAGANPPEAVKYETEIDTFKGLFAQRDIKEEYIDILYEEEMGPGIGLVTNAAFADMLLQQKKAIGYIVAYNGETSVPGAARRFTSDLLDDLKRYKVDAKRVKTIYGGVRKQTMLQLWILPPDAPPPATDAGPEEPPKKNVKVTSQSELTLGHPENQRAVFNRMLEVLRAQPTLKAFVIVTLEAAAPERVRDPEVEGELADLPRLMQKWRDDLVTHKIRPDRFIVVFTTALPDEGGGYFDLWVVPPGEPFPDPDEEEDEPSDVVQDPERRP